MPYRNNDELPERVRNHLPDHAQDIFREAFNHAFDRYGDPQKRHYAGTREAAASRVAWAAVKQRYRKEADIWIALDGAGPLPSFQGRPVP